MSAKIVGLAAEGKVREDREFQKFAFSLPKQGNARLLKAS